MATSGSKGGGFSIGVVYGLIVSIVLYLVFSFLFPLEVDNAGSASAGIGVASAPEASAAAPTVGATPDNAGPQAPDSPAAMMQPEVDGETGVAIGGGQDSSPATLVNPQIASGNAEAEPVLETRSAEVPDIGNGSPATAEPAAASTAAPVVANTVEAGNGQAVAPEALAQTASGPAVEVFAVAFTGDTSMPMLAIIIEDTLETSLQPLVDTGQPLSFALPADVDSSVSAQSIRESGFEVVAMLPPGISKTDGVAENMNRFMQNVPVAVAMIDASATGIMLDRDAMQVVLDTTRPAGLGVITFAGPGDLIARDQALRAGAAYGNVVQIIDRTPDVDLIVQALDRAAFEASTKGSAIVFARTKPETIEAIVRWMDGAFAQRLQIVPVSVAIQRQAN